MISVIHAPAEELAPHDEYPIPAGGQLVELDWDCVGQAFGAVSELFAWDADVRVYPERRQVELVIPAERIDHVAETTLAFYGAVAERIGMEAFMSIWVDFDVAR